MYMRICPACGRYTLKESCPVCGNSSISAHPAKFTPDDKFSQERIEYKKRVGAYITQTHKPVF
eukprot:gnl/Chilomastix_caulleri/5222.p2 GENE.gnl/Chilomastix_caulleri/5222~~gnl/Chilomastix_caulleri/5222.p2  ORF type:complete len:63 (+),score=6.75 gnl/Chilomastix_caulleri/5222:33-221(+)